MSPEKRYNVLRTCLILSVCLLAFSVPRVLGAPAQASDAGNRYKICFTATDHFDNGTANPFLVTTKCFYVTVLGACTKYTADVFLQGTVNLQDVSAVFFHYGQNETGRTDPWNPLGDSSVDLNDIACEVSMFGQTGTLP